MSDWIEEKECYYSTEPQGTVFWDALHTGCISASKCASYLQMSSFSDSFEESAKQCVGLSSKKFNSEQIDRTQIGIVGEPIVRDWYSSYIRKKINQVGIAVWKKDVRFRASLDGIYDNGAIEIKITNSIYKPLIKHIQSIKRGFTPPKDFHSHIWDSHYIQMVQSMAVTGKESIDYIVCSYETNEVYIERIYKNMDFWEQEIYPKGVHFLQTYVEPLMKLHTITRIDPPQSIDSQ